MYPSVAVANKALTISKAKELGHEVINVVEWMDMDDAGVVSKCECGWRSREVRAVAHAARLGYEHLKEVTA